MPRLSHKKTRFGCQRCKARKVKCDESKPRCSACSRHNVECDYVEPTPIRTPQQQSHLQRSLPVVLSPPPQDRVFTSTPISVTRDAESRDHTLELRLIHQWTAYTSTSFSAAGDFWRLQAPLVAMEHRHLMDAILALAALHLSRTPAQHWLAREGRMEPLVPSEGALHLPSEANQDSTPLWKMDPTLLSGYKKGLEARASSIETEQLARFEAQRRVEMLAVSQFYFDRALEGHSEALINLNRDNVEAAYLTSIIVSFNALFELGERAEDTLSSFDPCLWVRLARGVISVCDSWKGFVGETWVVSAGVVFGPPDLSNESELFDSRHAKPFEKVLTFALEYEVMSQDDSEAYTKALAYIGLTYKNVMDRSEPVLATSRRFTAMPCLVPHRFAQLVELQTPRAMVILAHLFATMKLIESQLPWFQGIANQQIPKIDEQIPKGWKEIMAWPSAVLRGDIRVVRDTDIRNIIT